MVKALFIFLFSLSVAVADVPDEIMVEQAYASAAAPLHEAQPEKPPEESKPPEKKQDEGEGEQKSRANGEVAEK